MKKLLLGVVATLVIALSIFALFSCAPQSNIPEDLDLSGITMADGTVWYDGAEHSLSVSGKLPENVSVVYAGNSQVEVGTYTVTAKFYYAGEYVVGKDITAKLTIKSLSDLTTPTVGMYDKTVDYNGAVHSILLDATLPEGVTVEYVGNGQTAAGSYTVTAKLYYKGIYLEGKDLSANLVINKKSLESAIYELAFNSTTVVYDGEEHSIFISGNLPDVVSVSYDGNGVSALGTHPVTATLTLLDEANYTLETTTMTATITIKELGIVVPTVDLSGITLPGGEVTYDGTEHSLAIVGTLPDDVTVEYVGNGKVNAGSYSVAAKFYYKGIYLEGKDLTATLQIGKKSVLLDGITFESVTIIYDGKAHSIAINGTLPEGVTAIYEGNGVTDEGIHTVTVSFATSGNYEPIDDTMEATIEIMVLSASALGVEFASGEFVYDGTVHSLAILGEEVLSGSGISFLGYDGNGKTDVGEYTVTAKFGIKGVYEPSLDMTATLIIKPAEIKVSAPQTTFEFTFDGSKKFPDALIWDGEKPADITVVVVGEAERLVGTYTITYKFVVSGNRDNYIAKEDITVTMIINDDPTFATEGLIFAANKDSTYYVKGYEGTATNVIIPSTYEGKAVTAIAYGAFDGMSNLTYVRVPDSVEAIGQAAFRGCTSLEAITLPFVGGSHNSSNEYFGYIFGASAYPGNAQFVPETLKVVELSGVNVVPAYSFWGCTSIEEVRINSGVEIGISAFRGCSALTKVTIAESVVTIQGAAAINSPFIDCSDDLVIYLEATAVPEGFTSTWTALDTEGKCAEVVLGK